MEGKRGIHPDQGAAESVRVSGGNRRRGGSCPSSRFPETDRLSLRTYIANQEEHHRVKSFREELIDFLEKSGVAYDPRYLD